jgi:hypothetical protein
MGNCSQGALIELIQLFNDYLDNIPTSRYVFSEGEIEF